MDSFTQLLKNQNFHIGCGPGTLLFQVGPDAFFWGLAWGLCWKLCSFLHICFKTKTSTLAVDLAPYFSNLALRPSFGAWSGAWVGNCAAFYTIVSQPELLHWLWGLAPYFSNLALMPSSGAWPGACVGKCADFYTFALKPKIPHWLWAWHFTFPIWP